MIKYLIINDKNIKLVMKYNLTKKYLLLDRFPKEFDQELKNLMSRVLKIFKINSRETNISKIL